MKVIDALGVACPGPVVAAKKELEEGKKEGFQILVDNQIAVDNLRKFASSQNCEFAYTRLEEKKYDRTLVSKNGRRTATGSKIGREGNSGGTVLK